MSRVFDATQISSEQSLKAPSISALVGLTAVSVCAWINTDGRFDEVNSGSAMICMKSVPGGITNALALSSPTFTPGEPPNLNCDVATSPGFAGFVSVETIPLNQWTHVAMVWDQVTGVMHGYINGVECTYSQHVNSTNPPYTDNGG